jgi:NAD(P)-dependent dehydrogenase (short-subunit alcohol dehydrogenase family)
MKTILITGATDGIGRLTAEKLLAEGHRVLLHGRSQQKLNALAAAFVEYKNQLDTFIADFSSLKAVSKMADEVISKYSALDVLINNAGVYKVTDSRTAENLDVRVAVNTIAPLLLTQKLLSLLGKGGRVVNLSSAAQAPVDIEGLLGNKAYSDQMAAYAQSKLAITMWTKALAEELGSKGPIIIAVNPASLLGSKMVKQGFGVAGGDLSVGADILIRAALSEEFTEASGKYFDNDIGRFADPHSDAMKPELNELITKTIRNILKEKTGYKESIVSL